MLHQSFVQFRRAVSPSHGAESPTQGPHRSPGLRAGPGRARRLGAWLSDCLARGLERRISPEESTRRRIQRERELVARGRPQFSVLVFDVGDPDRDPRPARALVRVLRGRLRIGDEFGWIVRGRVAVVLPVTDPQGASAVAADVVRLLRRDGRSVPCTLQMDRPAAQAQLAPRVEITAGRVRASNDRS